MARNSKPTKVQAVRHAAQTKFEQAKAAATSPQAIEYAKTAGKYVGIVAGIGLGVGVASAIADKTYALLS